MMGQQGEYDLDVLLNLRKKERDEAETRYAKALSRHQELGKRVQKLEANHREMVQERRKKCREFDDQLGENACALVHVQNFDHYVEGMRDREEQAWDLVEKKRREQRMARRAMNKAQSDMRNAVRQLKAVQKHFEKWKQEQALIKKRKQAAKMDDVAARMWRENRR